jgi:hypothetical protein
VEVVEGVVILLYKERGVYMTSLVVVRIWGYSGRKVIGKRESVCLHVYVKICTSIHMSS